MFDKDFIVVPIHDDDHWLLAIICFPYLKDAYGVEDNNIIVVPTVNGRRKRIETVPILRRPCILVFDSVRGNGSRKTRVIKYLKDYLEHEYIAQQKIDGLEDKEFWKSSILGHSVIVSSTCIVCNNLTEMIYLFLVPRTAEYLRLWIICL